MQLFGRRNVNLVLVTGIVLAAMILVATGCAPRVVGTVDVPVGDDMATQIKKGTTIYTENVPAFVLKGTGAFTADFSATVKVTSVDDTRTLRGEITSPTTIVGQNPERKVVILYLCQPLSPKANRLSDGTIVYSGDGYPKIIIGQSYDVVGVLQKPWQDYPYVYIASAIEFKQNPGVK